MNAAADKNAQPRRGALLQRHGSQAAKFAGVGFVNTALDFAVFMALHAAGLIALGANVASFFSANAASYALNAKFTFRKGKRVALADYGRFLSVHLASLALSTAFIAAFADTIGALQAKIVAAAVTFIWNYAGSAFFVFRKGADRP